VSVLKLPPCHSRAIGFAENAAVSKTQNSLFVVSYIDDIPTPTFNDFIRVLYDIVEEKQLDHLTFRGTEVGFPSKIVHVSNDLTQWRGKTFDLVLFDEQAHGWKKMDYKDYVKSIK